MSEKDLAVASGNLRDRVETCGLRGGRESRESKEGILEITASNTIYK